MSLGLTLICIGSAIVIACSYARWVVGDMSPRKLTPEELWDIHHQPPWS